MNHLAHLRLSPADPDWRLGSLLGDFVRGEDWQRWPDRVKQGIELHRAVDAFTDAHRCVRASVARVDGPLRRFAPVLVDVFYDHFLLQRWHELGPGTPVATFAAEVYALLDLQSASLPERLRRVVPRMIEHRWLEQSRDLDGVHRVLERIAMRLSRPVPLPLGAEILACHYEAFAGDFAAFWPEVARFAQQHHVHALRA
ncbi:MAG: ACP phosphodiesterase [Planctomycetota bacterium]